MNIEFVPFERSDCEDLTAMIKSLYKQDPEGEKMNELKINNTIDHLLTFPASGNILMIKTDKRNIGYSIIINYWSNEYGGNIIFLDELYIRPECRNQKTGTGFLKWLITKRFNNCKAILLETLPSNLKALEFYKKSGFSVSERKNLIFIT